MEEYLLHDIKKRISTKLATTLKEGKNKKFSLFWGKNVFVYGLHGFLLKISWDFNENKNIEGNILVEFKASTCCCSLFSFK